MAKEKKLPKLTVAKDPVARASLEHGPKAGIHAAKRGKLMKPPKKQY